MGRRVVEPGILRPRTSFEHFDYVRHEPATPLADVIENFWTITWELPAGETYTAQVLPYPSVNLSITNTESEVTGLVRRRYDRQLTGHGYAVGARFRPACFRPFVSFPVSRLTDRHRPITEVLGRPTGELRSAIEATADQTVRVALLAEFLSTDRPFADASASMLADVVTELARNREITRVAQVAALAHLSVRSLQRAFSDYVGAGPKWVVQRCRLQDAAARAAAAETVDWAALADELGFADQAHLTRAFTATIGLSPAAYARQAQVR
jgi:AraC-like DNA-binding protein